MQVRCIAGVFGKGLVNNGRIIRGHFSHWPGWQQSGSLIQERLVLIAQAVLLQADPSPALELVVLWPVMSHCDYIHHACSVPSGQQIGLLLNLLKADGRLQPDTMDKIIPGADIILKMRSKSVA